jgi:tetratricopeptide (TPR) repeat protein
MLLTHRPGQISLVTDAGTPNEEYPIGSSDAAQQADIEAYLRQEADRPEIRQAREAATPPISIDRFVAVLKAKSEGNFQYLAYVRADIAARRGGLTPFGLEALPSGLRGYYQQFWSQMEQVRGQEGRAEWNRIYRPVIAFLAAAREAVPESWLEAMVGRPADEIIERALQRWRRFLGQERKGGSERWRVVHQSFVDFLVEGKKVNLSKAHNQVASFYLSAWGGLDAGLPALFDPAQRGELDDYGLRHLAVHLERADRLDDLHRLLGLEWRDCRVEAGPARTENAWYAARERVGQTEGYMNDLARVARLVQVANRPDVGPSQYKTLIGLRIRYALMSTSVNNLARNIPPTLIAALVEKRVWLSSQGLAYARMLPPEKRVDALIELSTHLDHDEKRTVLQEALDAARGIVNESARASALARLGRPEEALAVAREIGDERARAGALEVLAPRLTEPGHVNEALAVAGEIGDDGARAGALAALAPRMAATGQVDEALALARGIEHEWARASALAALAQLDEALAVARGIGPEGSRALALLKMTPHLANTAWVNEALAVASGIVDEGFRAVALVALAPRLAELGQLDEALNVVRMIGPERARAGARAGLAPHLANAGRIDEAMAAVRESGNERQRARALEALAPHLPDAGWVKDALAMMQRIGDEEAQGSALARLALHLAKSGQADEALAVARGIGPALARASALRAMGRVDEALAAALQIGDEIIRAFALAELVPRLAAMGRIGDALVMAQGIEHNGARNFAMAELVPHLADAGRVDEALTMARGIGDEVARARALAALGQVDAALAIVREIDDELARAIALTNLTPHLTTPGQVEEALAVMRGIGNEGPRAFALASLAPHLVELGRGDDAMVLVREIDDEWVLARTLAALGRIEEALVIARGIGNEGSRAVTLAALAPRLAALPQAKAFPLWAETLQFSATRSRMGLLADLSALAPVITALGGADAIAESCRAIEDVGRWWP